MLNFIAEIKTQQHLDVEYIFLNLRWHKAFHFSATPSTVVSSQPLPLVVNSQLLPLVVSSQPPFAVVGSQPLPIQW